MIVVPAWEDALSGSNWESHVYLQNPNLKVSLMNVVIGWVFVFRNYVSFDVETAKPANLVSGLGDEASLFAAQRFSGANRIR